MRCNIKQVRSKCFTATPQPQMNLPHPKKKIKLKIKQWIAQAQAWQQYKHMACNVFLFWHFKICRCPIKTKMFPGLWNVSPKIQGTWGYSGKRSHLLGSTWYQIDATYVSLRRTNSLSRRFSWNVVHHNTTNAVFRPFSLTMVPMVSIAEFYICSFCFTWAVDAVYWYAVKLQWTGCLDPASYTLSVWLAIKQKGRNIYENSHHTTFSSKWAFSFRPWSKTSKPQIHGYWTTHMNELWVLLM